MGMAKPLPRDFDWRAHKIKTDIKNLFSDPETWAKGKEVEYLICNTCGALVEKSRKKDHYWWHKALERY